MTHHNNTHTPDVVAVFDSQLEADDAILHLRNAGVADRRIGYFTWSRFEGMTNLLDRNYGFAGAVIGGILGALMGVGAARVLNDWSLAFRDLGDFFGLAVTLGMFGSLFVGTIGWGVGIGIHKSHVEAPAIAPTVGPFILAVEAGNEGNARDRVWSVLRRAGGHEPPR